MESFAGADPHKRVTQLAVLRDGQPPSQFRFPNDPKTVHAVLKKTPQGHKDSGRGHGVVATRTELAVRRWSIVTDELIGQLRLLPLVQEKPPEE